jgi:hypothetical protein
MMKKTPRAHMTSGVAAWPLLALALAALAARAGAQTEANLISNPGFEQSLTPWVYDAANYGGAGDGATLDPRNPRSGQYSLGAGAGHVAYRNLGVRADTSVELRFWARGETAGVPVTILLRQSSPGDRVLLRMEMIFTAEWREYVFRTSLPADLAAGAQVYLGFWLHAPGR